MRVGIYVRGIPPSSGGGHTIQEDIFLSFLAARQDSPHEFVLLSDEPEHILALPGADSIPILPAHLQRSPQDFIKAAERRIPLVGRRLSPQKAFDAFEAAVVNSQIDFLWPLRPSKFSPVDVPFLYTIWDLQHRLEPWFPEVSHNGQWKRREGRLSETLGRAAAIVVGNEAGKAEVVSFYNIPEDRIHILPHPTPDFALAGAKAKDLATLAKFSLPPNYLLYPAQFWSHKNHVNLLLALQHLRSQYALILPMVFVGSDQGNYAFIREMVEKLELSSQVHFLGFISREELVALYQNALALTYVSFFGPENLPPLEAFALGCPVIAADVHGSR